ncbi:MAG: TldD/PmbA family protein [Candidatus Obscuribacterales bacterium]|jgi:PmbA protein
MTSSKNTMIPIAEFVIKEGKRLGATECDVRISYSNSVDTGVRLGEVETLEGANSRSLQFEAYVGKKSASTSTSDLRRPALTELVRNTIAMASASEEDPFAGLPEAKYLAKKIPDLGLTDDAIAKITTEEKIQIALAAESAARGYDERITNSRGASFTDWSGSTVYANSHGFVGTYSSTHCSISAAVVASQGDQMQVGGWSSGALSYGKLESPEQVGITAAKRALRMLGAKKVKSQVVPVVFDPLMAAQLLAQFVGATAGSHVYRNSSFLAGKLDQMVASEAVTIIDNPLMIGGLGSRPYDGEGLPALKRTLVTKGKLSTYLLSSYSARKLSTTPNSGSTGNLHFEPGTLTPEEIIASVGNGLFLTSVSGPGFNVVTGDYSRGASGLWIENGELTFPVEGITIAGNMLDMFANIDAIGNDLIFRSSTVSPTIKIGSMMVAGD